MGAITQDLYNALVETVQALDEDIKDLGPCDHSVGLCICSMRHASERAHAAIKAYEAISDSQSAEGA